MADLPLGTVIENTAAIFFDFNEPVITNTTVHRLGEDYLEVVSVGQPAIPGLEVTVTPNPFRETAVMQISGIDFQNGLINLYSAQGKLLKREGFHESTYTLHRENLPEGVYWFELILDGHKGFAGKLVVH